MLRRKFLAVVLTFIILLMFSFKSEALSGNGFIWNKTEIEIPLDSNFLDYLDEFKVSFYYKGEMTSEEVKVKMDDFYYGDLTVSTSEVGTKTVKLIATVAGYSSFDRKDILVHIVDKEAPKIELRTALIFTIGNPVNYEDYFIFQDNDEIITKVIDDSKVNYTVLGNYEITVSISDKSLNTTSNKYTVSIIDKLKPSISTVSFIEVEYGNLDFDIRDYVSANDDLDGDITANVKIDGLDVYKLGEQVVTIYVSDSSGNEEKVSKTITVVDREAPKLELSTYYDTIYMSDTDLDLAKYISKVEDNCTKLTVDSVTIDASDFELSFGSHKVVYTVCDEALNYSKRILTLNVTYDEAPVINASDMTFKQNEKFDLRDYIKVTDKYDSTVSDSYTIDDSVLDVTKPGTYEVIIEAINKAGLKTQKVIYITISKENSEAKDSTNEIYDYIYENKKMVGIIIVILTIGVVYYLKNKKKKIQ